MKQNPICPDEEAESSILMKRGLLWGGTSAFVLVALAVLLFLEKSVSGAGFNRSHVSTGQPLEWLARFGQEIMLALLWPVRAAVDWLPGINVPGVAYLYIGALGFIYGGLLFGFRLLILREIERDT